MRLPKLSSQGSKKTIPKELVDANNQVFEKIHEELKARSMLRTAEDTKKRHLSEKSSLEAKIVELEMNKSSEFLYQDYGGFNDRHSVYAFLDTLVALTAQTGFYASW
ncbi:hypothetical protein MTR67_002311, partial [Solanum verrucosum]